MPTKKSAPRWHEAPGLIPVVVAAQPVTEHVELPLSAAPIAEATRSWPPRTMQPCPSMAPAANVLEIFRKDGTYSFCQCQENVADREVCGKRIKSVAGIKPLWNHVERFHPRTYLQLGAGGHDEIAHSASADRLASRAQTGISINVTYQQMVDSLSCAQGKNLSDAINALLQAREQRQA